MEQRPLGQTGINVSAIGFGCGDQGGLMTRGDAGEQRRAVSMALEAGINFFDTADSYGRGASEETLGRTLRELGADPWVATKVTRSDVELSDDGKTIRRSLEESLGRLGRDRVDLFLLHGRVGDGGMDVDRVLGPIAEGMVAVREAGLTRFIGFNGLGDTAAIHKVAHAPIWDAAHCYINALNPSAGWDAPKLDQQDFKGLIGHCAEHGVGAIAIRVLAAGALAGDAPRHPVSGGGSGRPMVTGAEWDREVERTQKVQVLAAELGLESALELSLRFVLSHPSISTALLGYSDSSHLEAALRWANRGPLDASAVERVLALYR